MIRGAVISGDGRFRYHLLRIWREDASKTLVFIMLNPSTADASIDDPTIRRCIAFGQQEGYRGIEVINLYAYRATSPADLKSAGWPVGELNASYFEIVAAGAAFGGCDVCVAWGAFAGDLSAAAHAIGFFKDRNVQLQCLGTTKSSHPAHPLYLPSATTLRPFP